MLNASALGTCWKVCINLPGGSNNRPWSEHIHFIEESYSGKEVVAVIEGMGGVGEFEFKFKTKKVSMIESEEGQEPYMHDFEWRGL